MHYIKTNKPTTILFFSALFSAFLIMSNTVLAEPLNESLVANSVAEHPLVNINTAGIENLTKLKGIGEKKAQAIIDYRQEYGQFETVEQLLNVKGIGIKVLESNKTALKL